MSHGLRVDVWPLAAIGVCRDIECGFGCESSGSVPEP